MSEEFDFPQHKWAVGDKQSISIHAPDTSQVYQMEIRILHAEDYSYQNLYVKTVTTFPSGKEVSSITSLQLAHPDGSWAGECSGSKCSVALMMQERFTFPERGTYRWVIEPYMRMDTVPGIIGISVICKKKKG